MTYEEFIQNILDTRGKFNCEGYHERHHIIPKCCGGTNDEENLIDLYAREHFEAHRLLALENPENDGLVYAWWNMAHCKKEICQDRYVCTPEEYEDAKITFIETHKKRKVSDETKKRISENHADISGEKNPMFGKHHSEESKKKMSENKIGKYYGKTKPVICLSTGIIYNSTAEAERKTGVSHQSIGKCCGGKTKSAGRNPINGKKMLWAYYTEEVAV